jgi:hypothetical protein
MVMLFEPKDEQKLNQSGIFRSDNNGAIIETNTGCSQREKKQ